jgi:hypothetical protein
MIILCSIGLIKDDSWVIAFEMKSDVKQWDIITILVQFLYRCVACSWEKSGVKIGDVQINNIAHCDD